MENFTVELPKKRSSIIKVIGVGGGGSNAVNHMYSQGVAGVDFFVCNTDSQDLDMSPVPNKIQIGNNLTEGLGAGSDPEMGKKSAMESINRITEVLRTNTKMVFVTAGMGGGTGTGAAPIIAKAAKDMGILSVGIVTIPFEFEGPGRINQARAGIEELRPHVDALLTISNDRITEMYGDLRYREAYAKADDILCTAAKGIAEIITVPGIMNVDFKDVRSAMVDSGKAIMGTGISKGEERAMEAAKKALESPLLNDTRISGAQNILVNISYGTEEPYMREINEVNKYFQAEAGQNAVLKCGVCHDESLEDEICVTIIATGFEEGFKVNETEFGSIEVDFEEEFPPIEDIMVQEEPEAEEELKKPDLSNAEFERRQQLLLNIDSDKVDSDDLDVPAYLRNGVQLEDSVSSDGRIERIELVDDKEEDEEPPQLRDGNSFLYDNVD
jgi:cell division protein FtsZ